MDRKVLIAIFTTLFCGAIMASAKAILDVHVLKAENVNTKELLLEVRQDVKDILKRI